MKQALVIRLEQHRNIELQESAVYHYIQHTVLQFRDKYMFILEKESNWHERGVREAVRECIKQPSLNKKGGPSIQLIQELGPGVELDSWPFVT